MTRREFATTLGLLATAPRFARAASDPGFIIGLAADAQYADVEPKGTRFYRRGRPRLAEALEHFNARGVAFSVHLGDLIDRNWQSFDDMLPVLATSRAPCHQLLGNHDFDVLDEYKSRVPQRLGLNRRHRCFDFQAFRFVVLDTNDVSTYGHPAGAPEQVAAAQELARLEAAKVRQAKVWNGGIGPAQLAWFDEVCREAGAAGRKVIVCAHHPVFPANEHNLWNAAEVLAVIDRHPHLVAWFNGHNHAGGFGERNGVPFVTLRGMVETANTTAYATAEVLADRVIVTGQGREPSRELVLRKT
jgi:manganese-dependent ADP-ribose/CDP-alcohol diphosphatase